MDGIVQGDGYAVVVWVVALGNGITRFPFFLVSALFDFLAQMALMDCWLELYALVLGGYREAT